MKSPNLFINNRFVVRKKSVIWIVNFLPIVDNEYTMIELISIVIHGITQQGRNSVSEAGGHNPPIPQNLEAGGVISSFVKIQHQNTPENTGFFDFVDQKKQNFQKQGALRPTRPPPVFTFLITHTWC